MLFFVTYTSTYLATSPSHHAAGVLLFLQNYCVNAHGALGTS